MINKKDKNMDDMDKKARMSVLKEMRQSAMDSMGGGMHDHLKKVTVAAPSTDLLKTGLKKAEDVVSELPHERIDEGYEEDTNQELQQLVDNCHSVEDLDKKIEFLQEAKEKKFGTDMLNEEDSEMSSDEEMEEEY